MKSLLRSFAGGEITPELYGRLDLTKFQTGLALAQNMQTLPHGPATRRPGMQFIQRAKGATGGAANQVVRLIPFSFSSTQAIVLEFGHNYVRFHTKDGTVLEADEAIVSIAAEIVEITGHPYADGDWLYIGTQFYIVVDVPDADHVEVTDLWGVSATPVGATAARVYTLAVTFEGPKLFELHYAQSNDVLTVVHPDYPATELRRAGAANWSETSVSFAPSIAAPGSVSVTATVAVATNLTPQTYVVTAIAADGITESVASASDSDNNNLTLAGNYNTITWGAVGGASRYNVYKQHGGTFGYIGQTTTTTLVDDNVLADTMTTPPEAIYELNHDPGYYPAAVCYYEQRRVFGGSTYEPQTIYATRSGTESNLTSSLPSQDDDALKFKIASRRQASVLHLSPLSDLVALTPANEYRISSGDAPLSPTTLMVKPQGGSGASQVQPVEAVGALMYVQAQGNRVRELSYNWEVNSYRSIDISIMAPHLLEGYTVTDMAYARAPDPVLWCVRSDGVLLGMTYVPEQQVYAWHRHETDGVVESVCTISEDNADVLYLAVKRTINGQTVRYIERMKPRFFDLLADAFFVDAGLTYDGAAATTITGLHHLEGETVDVLADGAVALGLEVTDGAITLEDAASVVHVGLPYVSRLQTLPMALEGAQAFGQGTPKQVGEVALRVRKTSLLAAGPSFDDLVDLDARAVATPYDSPPELYDGVVELRIPTTWTDDGQVCVEQTNPLPLTVSALVVDFAAGG